MRTIAPPSLWPTFPPSEIKSISSSRRWPFYFIIPIDFNVLPNFLQKYRYLSFFLFFVFLLLSLLYFPFSFYFSFVFDCFNARLEKFKCTRDKHLNNESELIRSFFLPFSFLNQSLLFSLRYLKNRPLETRYIEYTRIIELILLINLSILFNCSCKFIVTKVLLRFRISDINDQMRIWTKKSYCRISRVYINIWSINVIHI